MTLSDIMNIMLYGEAAVFLILGLVNMRGRPILRPGGDGELYPVNFYRTLGSSELAVSLFIMVPQTRIWALIAGGLIAFFAIVNLLKHSRYGWSVPAILFLITLVPVSMLHG